jgi:methylated-DNA-[protein]-cysteine S-methyltransferase
MNGATGMYGFTPDILEHAVEIGIASGRVIDVSFPRSLSGDAQDDHPLIDHLVTYFSGEQVTLAEVDIALTVDRDTRRVLETVREISYGETVEAEALLRSAGFDPEEPADRTTVSTALSKNPVPILIPDHRIRGFNGAPPSEISRRLRALEQH